MQYGVSFWGVGERYESPWFETTQEECVRKAFDAAFNRLCRFAALVMLIVGLLINALDSYSPWVIVLVCLATFAFVIAFYRFYTYPAYYRQRWRMVGSYPERFIFDSFGIENEFLSGARSIVPWSLISKVRKAESGYFFKLSSGQEFWLPNRALSPDFEKQILELWSKVDNKPIAS